MEDEKAQVEGVSEESTDSAKEAEPVEDVNLIYGPLLRNHLPALFHARNHPSVFGSSGQEHFLTEQEHANWFEAQAADRNQQNYILSLAGEKKTVHVGVIGLKGMDRIARIAEFNICIFPEYQGKKIGADAMYLLMNLSFGIFNLNLVWGQVLESNKRALSLFDRVGFKREAGLRSRYYKSGQYIDSVILSITREEFEDAASRSHSFGHPGN